MRRVEWALVALVYVCATLVAISAVRAFHLDTGIALVIGAATGSMTAAWLYHRRDANAAPMGFLMLVGAMMAILCVGVGAAAQWLWRVMPLPEVTLLIATVGTFLFPLLLTGTMRKAMSKRPPTDAPIKPAKIGAITAGAVVAAIGAVAWATIASDPASRMRAVTLPGLVVSLPDWTIAAQSSQYERGEFKLHSPEGFGRSITLRWESAVPEGMYDELLTRMWSDMGMNPDGREAVTVAGHRGSRMFVSNPGKRVFVTTWRCPEDSRSWILTTFLEEPKALLLATHEAIVASIHCHTEGKRAAPDPLYASFTPPPGWTRAPKEIADVGFLGPNEELVVVSMGGVGKHEMIAEKVPDDAMALILKSLLSLQSLDTPRLQRRTVTDRHGHVRTVWSCAGRTEGGAESIALQAKLMAWHCPIRNATFMLTYMTPESHETSTVIDILLGAGCHE